MVKSVLCKRHWVRKSQSCKPVHFLNYFYDYFIFWLKFFSICVFVLKFFCWESIYTRLQEGKFRVRFKAFKTVNVIWCNGHQIFIQGKESKLNYLSYLKCDIIWDDFISKATSREKFRDLTLSVEALKG